jgi:hypothetical protein
MDMIEAITAQASVKNPPGGFVLNPKAKCIKNKPAIIIKAEPID